jgi:flagellar motor protein MotB
MLDHGVRPDQIVEIRGYADRKPITSDSAEARNRRISIVLLFDGNTRANAHPGPGRIAAA